MAIVYVRLAVPRSITVHVTSQILTVIVMPIVFISHAEVDHDFVRRDILGFLEGAGIETWLSGVDIREGTDWERSINSSIQKCDQLVVALTWTLRQNISSMLQTPRAVL